MTPAWSHVRACVVVYNTTYAYECFPPPGTYESFGSTEKVTVFAKIIVNSTSSIAQNSFETPSPEVTVAALTPVSSSWPPGPPSVR